MAAELGKAELEFVTSITAPIFWVIRDASGPPRSGSAFFLDAGKGPFGVTAQHVIAGWRTDHCSSNIEALQISDLSIDFTGQNQIIDEHEELDIATFRIGAEEISKIGKAVLTGNQSEWPPPPPQKNKDVYFSGFSSTETCLIPPNEFLFGAAAGHGFVSSVNEKNAHGDWANREWLVSAERRPWDLGVSHGVRLRKDADTGRGEDRFGAIGRAAPRMGRRRAVSSPFQCIA